jgi:hypothetical protein
VRRARQLSPGSSDVDVFCDLNDLIYFDTEVANGARDLGVAEKRLNGAQIARPTMDQRGVGPPKRVRTELHLVETDARHPFADETRVLPHREPAVAATSATRAHPKR